VLEPVNFVDKWIVIVDKCGIEQKKGAAAAAGVKVQYFMMLHPQVIHMPDYPAGPF
jgi:hypothetical protein